MCWLPACLAACATAAQHQQTREQTFRVAERSKNPRHSLFSSTHFRHRARHFYIKFQLGCGRDELKY
jgi:hypothetical protein